MSFDVTTSGEVTNVIALLGGASLAISARYPVDSYGGWGGAVSGPGIEASVEGRLMPDGASGTLLVTLARQGTAEPMPVAWCARLVGDEC